MKHGVRGGYTGGDGPKPQPPTTGSGVQYHQAPADAAPVGCTCHPDEAPKPCPRRHAYSECKRADLARKARLFREGASRLYESSKGDMWYFELYHFLKDVSSELSE